MVWLNLINEFRATSSVFVKLITTRDQATDKLPAAERASQNIFYKGYININILLNHRRPVGETGFKRKTISGQYQRTTW